ncbi:MAG: hypothetical protein OZ928_14840 [Polyangiaceae bacterium]|nr:hypothetical protein [Polyangiaceae bacterium]
MDRAVRFSWASRKLNVTLRDVSGADVTATLAARAATRAASSPAGGVALLESAP